MVFPRRAGGSLEVGANDDAARGLLIFLDAADDHAVAKRAKFHGELSLIKFSIYKRLNGAARTGRRVAALPWGECYLSGGYLGAGPGKVKRRHKISLSGRHVANGAVVTGYQPDIRRVGIALGEVHVN